jgi:hypothetical protein
MKQKVDILFVETGSVGDGNLSPRVGPLFLETSLGYCPKEHRQYIRGTFVTEEHNSGRS